MVNYSLSGDFQEFRFVYVLLRVPDMLSRERKKTQPNALEICPPELYLLPYSALV